MPRFRRSEARDVFPDSFFSRRETKYELNQRAADSLRHVVEKRLPCYEFRRGYPHTYITTIYFDTDRLDFYKRARVSYDDNLKIRVKEYYYWNNGAAQTDGRGLEISPFCFIEIKQRVQGLVLKRRMRVPKALLNRLVTREDIWQELVESWEDLVLSDPRIVFEDYSGVYGELRRYLRSFKVRPRSVIHYRRSVYQQNEQELRITFDDEVQVFRPVDGIYHSVDSMNRNVLGDAIRSIQKVIMEIKGQHGYPEWLKEALTSFLPRRTSKFTTSMSLLTRPLPVEPSGEDVNGK